MTHYTHSVSRRKALQSLTGGAALALELAAFTTASAQEAVYPSRPLHFVIPFPSGSGAELAARFFGQKITG